MASRHIKSAYDHSRCKWIKENNQPCSVMTGYTMVQDPDDPSKKIRKYNNFCFDHMLEAEKIDDAWR